MKVDRTLEPEIWKFIESVPCEELTNYQKAMLEHRSRRQKRQAYMKKYRTARKNRERGTDD